MTLREALYKGGVPALAVLALGAIAPEALSQYINVEIEGDTVSVSLGMDTYSFTPEQIKTFFEGSNAV